MIGTWRWNVALGLTGAVLTLLFSWSGNVWTDTLSKTLWSFVWLFAIGYAVRFVLGLVVGQAGADSRTTAERKDDGRGAHIDYVTPDETEPDVSDKRDDEPEPAFEPLTFPKLQTKKPEQSPEEVARVVRHFQNSD
ncbi:hypothetical protein ACFQWB_07425 [Paenibacillus thermoaerophilus]|jgi:hypothetical protein|uniref:Uncharacterized protein n=1 Tax=Paenibacillus thermoaerophilus TaxID=1215385 RepID=A0ABW2V4M8_9BACL|nr:hypothetical protein [Paenibacillus thermoaerophilus]TMV13818.1 hypothetical protein FE781_11510 [Paenibacillus thermoaerophilus]